MVEIALTALSKQLAARKARASMVNEGDFLGVMKQYQLVCKFKSISEKEYW